MRINVYDIFNRPSQVWCVLAGQIRALENDLCIVGNNPEALGEMPNYALQDLRALNATIERMLKNHKRG